MDLAMRLREAQERRAGAAAAAAAAARRGSVARLRQSAAAPQEEEEEEEEMGPELGNAQRRAPPAVVTDSDGSATCASVATGASVASSPRTPVPIQELAPAKRVAGGTGRKRRKRRRANAAGSRGVDDNGRRRRRRVSVCTMIGFACRLAVAVVAVVGLTTASGPLIAVLESATLAIDDVVPRAAVEEPAKPTRGSGIKPYGWLEAVLAPPTPEEELELRQRELLRQREAAAQAAYLDAAAAGAGRPAEPLIDLGSLARIQDHVVDALAAMSQRVRQREAMAAAAAQQEADRTETPARQPRVSLLAAISERVSRFSLNALFEEIAMHQPAPVREKRAPRTSLDADMVEAASRERRNGRWMPRLKVVPSGRTSRVQEMLDGRGAPFDPEAPWLMSI